MRVLMGDETTRRTRDELVSALRQTSNDSIEAAKVRDDDLSPLQSVRDALAAGKIDPRVYTLAKFHAKLYLANMAKGSLIDYALVGSSNFTASGMNRNLELNLLTTDQHHVEKLRAWYDAVWKDGEPVAEELLKIIGPHVADYDPFTVYARALHEYHSDKQKQEDYWDGEHSVIYKRLSKYQRDGYLRAWQIAQDHRGVLVCDGVGLGKTFVGLMVLERCIRERKRVLLIVPKSAKESVWMANIRRYLAPQYRRFFKEMFDIQLHTDFGRDGTIAEDDLDYFRKHKDVIIIDEAHHFRNPNSNRGQLLLDIARGKRMFMLTATPINNSLDDLYHLINYFTDGRPDHFRSLGINNLRQYFLEREKRIEAENAEVPLEEAVEQEDFLRSDKLLKEILIQRSRKFVRDSETITADSPIFPERQTPRVVSYSLKSVYASIYGELKEAFDKEQPFLSLAVYNTARYHRDPDKRQAQQQVQVIGLIRTLLLKRLESSYKAFEASVEDLLFKMVRFLLEHDREQYEAWATTNTRWWSIVQDHIEERLEQEFEEDGDMPPVIEEFKPAEYDMDALVRDIIEDLGQLTGFLSKIYRRFYHKDREGIDEDPAKDDKLQKLIALVTGDDLVRGNKVLIFSEFHATARYLERQLRAAGVSNVEEIDSNSTKNRERIIQRFAPHYNLFDDAEKLDGALADPIDVLVSTDVLSEGLNLQDASLIINYDLHWNPVRLMQRIGRVDRRLDPVIEAGLRRPAALDRKVYFWNFLPPAELDDLLRLKQKLDGKILRINKTLGIEGALLTPDDPDASMKLFNEMYEGEETVEELLQLERTQIQTDHPDLWESLPSLPQRLFSGRSIDDGFVPMRNAQGETVHSVKPPTRTGVFACYRMPPLPTSEVKTGDMFDADDPVSAPGTPDPNGAVAWFFYDAGTNTVETDLGIAWIHGRCAPGTPRHAPRGQKDLRPALKEIERHIRNSYLRDAQIPVGAKPRLIAWLEVSP